MPKHALSVLGCWCTWVHYMRQQPQEKLPRGRWRGCAPPLISTRRPWLGKGDARGKVATRSRAELQSQKFLVVLPSGARWQSFVYFTPAGSGVVCWQSV